tara:strand:+ start:474 stop:1655 length:1182 start_codon:yes stop_codon:yes gene_type:complete
MALTILQMAEEVCLNVGLRPTGSLSPAELAQLVNHMNFSQQLITRECNPRSLQNIDTTQALISGQATYTLPTAVKRIKTVRYFEPDEIALASTSTDVWVGGAGVVKSLDTSITRGGRSTTKLAMTTATSISYTNFTAVDYSAYSVAAIRLYLRTDTALAAGQLAFIIGETANAAESGTYTTTALPAITTTGSWVRVELTGLDLTNYNATIAVGLKAVSSTTAEINLDKIELLVDDGLEDRKGYHVKIETTAQQDTLYPNPSWKSTGRPSRMYLWGQTDTDSDMNFFPVPDKYYILKVRYEGYATTITDATASSNTTLRDFDDVIIAGATMYAFNARREWKAYGNARAQFFSLLKTAKVNNSKQDNWNPVMSGFGDTGGESVLHIDDFDFPGRS